MTAAPTPPGPPRLVFDHLDGDVWAWERTVSGTQPDGVDVVALRLHGEEHPVDHPRHGRFVAVVPLRSGANRIEALCLENGRLVSVAEVVYRVPLPPTPKARIVVSIDGGDVVLDARSSEPSRSNGTDLVGFFWSVRRLASELVGERVRLTPPPVDGEYRVTLRVVDANGEQDQAIAIFRVVDGTVRLVEQTERAPWISDAIVYGVLPPKFGRPPLKATTARLDYLKSLGVNALWLSPLNTTIPYHSGYEVIDYFTIREDCGTEDDFRDLVEAAHVRDIRVLMDFVPNHTSRRHYYHADAEEHGRRSVHYDLYDRDERGHPTHYFSWTHLPNLNFANPDVRRFVTHAMSYWVREFDVDGYRVDVAWGVKERWPEFWPELRRELKRIKPEVFLLAEASARDPYYVHNGFDAAYDWTDQLGQWAWHDVWDPPKGLVDRLHVALTNHGSGFDERSLILRFIDNNDTGERFVSRYGVGLTKVAVAMQFTLPGLPAPYTGEEFGAEFHPYDDLEPLDWERDPYELQAYYKRLFDLRHELAALRSTNFARVDADPAERVYAYVRWSTEFAPVVVVLNFSDRPTEARLAVPDQLAAKGNVVDRLHGEHFASTSPTTAIPMPAHTARVLTR